MPTAPAGANCRLSSACAWCACALCLGILTRVSFGADGRTRNGKMAADGGRSALPCAFSPKSRQFLALCAQDGRLRIWNTDSKTLQQEYVPSAHLSAACTCVTWGPCRASQVPYSIRGAAGGCGLLNCSLPSQRLQLSLCRYFSRFRSQTEPGSCRNIHSGCFRTVLAECAAHMLCVGTCSDTGRGTHKSSTKLHVKLLKLIP